MGSFAASAYAVRYPARASKQLASFPNEKLRDRYYLFYDVIHSTHKIQNKQRSQNANGLRGEKDQDYQGDPGNDGGHQVEKSQLSPFYLDSTRANSSKDLEGI